VRFQVVDAIRHGTVTRSVKASAVILEDGYRMVAPRRALRELDAELGETPAN
jgi:hypothetical protein